MGQVEKSLIPAAFNRQRKKPQIAFCSYVSKRKFHLNDDKNSGK